MPLDTITYKWPPASLDAWITDVENRPDPIWLIPNIIPYDCSVLISGRAKLGFKSWFAFYLTLCIALGKGTLDLFNPVKPEKVLFLEMEKPAKLTMKRWVKFLTAFGHGREALKDKVFFAHRYPITVDSIDDINRISQLIKEQGIKVLILDTLAEVHRGGEAKKEDLDLAMAAIRRFKADMNGGVVFFLHHIRKQEVNQMCDKGDIDEDIRGSSALAGFYDTHIAMRHYQSFEQKWIDVTIRQSDAEEVKYKLVWHIDDKQAYPTIEVQDANAISSERMMQYVAQLKPGKLYSINALIKLWQTQFEFTKSMVDALMERGELQQNENGRYELPIGELDI